MYSVTGRERMSYVMLRIRQAVQLTFLALLLLACEGLANPQTRPPLHPDAASYAKLLGVSADEASRRLNIQDSIGPLRERLRRAAGDRWVAGWLEHEPVFRYVVFLKHEVADLTALTTDWPLPVDFISGAVHTESDLLASMARIGDLLYQRLPEAGMWPDLKTGTIVINGPVAPGAELLAELQTLARVPVRYEGSPPEALLTPPGIYLPS